MTDNPLSSDQLATAVLQEVRDFHAFLADWFSGRSAAGAETLAAQRQRFAPNMQYISPSGAIVDATTIEIMLGGAHGGEPAIAIEIRNPPCGAPTKPRCWSRMRNTRRAVCKTIAG